MVRLVFDREAEKSALATLRELIDGGFAGNDCFDPDIFVVDAPAEQTHRADVACDILRGSFHRDRAYGVKAGVLQLRLPHWVRVELGLDRRDAPTIVTPLASRGVTGFLDETIDALVAGARDSIIAPAFVPVGHQDYPEEQQ